MIIGNKTGRGEGDWRRSGWNVGNGDGKAVAVTTVLATGDIR